MCVCVSRVQLFATPWPAALQAPLSMGFSRQEYRSGLQFPSPGVFAIQGPSPGLRHLRQSLHHLNHRGSPWYRLEGPELAIPRMRESLLLYPSCWSWPLSSMGCCGRSLSKELHRANSAVPLDNSPGKFFPKLTQPPIGVLVCLLEKHERNL